MQAKDATDINARIMMTYIWVPSERGTCSFKNSDKFPESCFYNEIDFDGGFDRISSRKYLSHTCPYLPLISLIVSI